VITYDEFGNLITNTHDIFADMRALKEKLNRAGFVYEHITSSGGYELPRQNQGAGKLLFKFKDKNDVIKLMDAVADVKRIGGNMTRIDYEPMTDAMTQRLFSKVYNQAVKTASIMAIASKQKLGELISVVDLKGDPSASSNIFSNMFSSFGRGANSENDSMVSSSTQTCKFRFELVD
jgi:hypothetical protein